MRVQDVAALQSAVWVELGEHVEVVQPDAWEGLAIRLPDEDVEGGGDLAESAGLVQLAIPVSLAPRLPRGARLTYRGSPWTVDAMESRRDETVVVTVTPA